jgi:hypothetical protein
MKRITKKQLIDEFENVFEECLALYDNELKKLYDENKITSGHYYYVLNPYKNWDAKNMYGLDGYKSMMLNKNSFKVWDFQYHLAHLKEHKQEMVNTLKEFC